MIIISGKYKGNKIKGYNINGTRPTMNRVKESLFGIIQSHIPNSICLDLFAGSGSLGLEALSMGSSKIYFVDNNKKVIDILKQNINKLNIKEPYELINKNYIEALKYFELNNIKFDLIFLDPPYNTKYISTILKYIYENKLLLANGQVICEYEIEDIQTTNYKIVKEKKYGSKKIMILEIENNK